MKKIITIIVLLLCIYSANAQVSIKDSTVAAPMFQINYGMHIPGGDYADRFGWGQNVGLNFYYKTSSNWLWGANFTYLFGNQVKNEADILSNIYTSDTSIIDGNGAYAEIHLYERGYYVAIMGGKLFPIFGPNNNSGLTIMGGVNFLQHKIRIENPENVAHQLSSEYLKGYDQLSNGIGITESIGYTHLGNNRVTSFTIGFEFTQSWTQCRRDYDFVTMQKIDDQRLDLTYSLKFGWILPLYKRSASNFYYY